jgi:hypothetical protein
MTMAPSTLRRRFWLEAIMAALSGFFAILTVVYKEWIELVFGIDPDAGNGSLEWAVVGVFALAFVFLALRARTDRRRLTAIST